MNTYSCTNQIKNEYFQDNKVISIQRCYEKNIKGSYKNEKLDNTSNKTPTVSHRNNQESKLKEEVYTMDDNKILEKYIDSVNENTREMERRLTENRIQSEKRIEEQRRLSEERMEDKFNRVIDKLEKTNDKLEKTNDKIDYNQKELQNSINSSIQRLDDKLDTTYKWIIGTCLATIIGIAAMVISVIYRK